MHVEPFVGGSNPPNSGKNMYMLIKTINLISVHWLYKILFDNNIVKCDYNVFNFKIYLILKLWYIFTNKLNENFNFNYKIVIINFLFKVFF